MAGSIHVTVSVVHPESIATTNGIRSLLAIAHAGEQGSCLGVPAEARGSASARRSRSVDARDVERSLRRGIATLDHESRRLDTPGRRALPETSAGRSIVAAFVGPNPQPPNRMRDANASGSTSARLGRSIRRAAVVLALPLVAAGCHSWRLADPYALSQESSARAMRATLV